MYVASWLEYESIFIRWEGTERMKIWQSNEKKNFSFHIEKEELSRFNLSMIKRIVK